MGFMNKDRIVEFRAYDYEYYVLDSLLAPDAEYYNLMRELKELEKALRTWM